MLCNTIQVWMGNSVTSVHNSVTSTRNIIPFQTLLVFYHCIKGMLHSKVMDDGYICRPLRKHLQINLY